MAKRKLRLSDVFEPIELDLEGPKFLLKKPTRTLEEKAEAWEERVSEIEEAEGEDFDRDAQVAALIEIVDVQLEPVAVEEGKKPDSAKKVLTKLYKDDAIGKATLDALIEQLAELRSDSRPLSAPRR